MTPSQSGGAKGRKKSGIDLSSAEAVQESIRNLDYIADSTLSTTLFLALALEKPLFLEGEAGVGKTELAKVLAKLLDTELIRLQCYEGLDSNSALYEWNYAKQLLHIKMEEGNKGDTKQVEKDIFSEEYLIERPLLRALVRSKEKPAVLLIDEIDRSDEEFEAFLLEILSDFQITIPEMGTIKAVRNPVVILTSNRTREIHDALKRRCYYHWIGYPDAARELSILTLKVPGAGDRLSREIVGFVQSLREQDLFKLPGISETIDWASALVQLDKLTLDPQTVNDTLGVLLKYQDDIAKIQGSEAAKLLEQVNAELTAAR